MRKSAIGMILLCVASAAPGKSPKLQPLSDKYLAWVARGSARAVSSARDEMRRRDAGDAEALADALGRAMQVAPARVLPLVDSAPGLSASWICTPFIGEDVSPKRAAAILRKSRRAIEAVLDPRLAKSRGACLREIQDGETALAKQR